MGGQYFGRRQTQLCTLRMEVLCVLGERYLLEDDLKYRLCFRRAVDARQAADHVLQLANCEPVVGSAPGQSQLPRPGVCHPTAQGGGQQLGDH